MNTTEGTVYITVDTGDFLFKQILALEVNIKA